MPTPKTRRRNPLRVDPTRTGTIRRRFSTSIRARYNALKGVIRKLVVEEDVFGLKSANQSPFVNTRWRPLTDEQKLTEFDNWLRTQQEAGVLQVTEGEVWTVQFTEDAYRKGQSRAFDDARPQVSFGGEFGAGQKTEFLRTSLGGPIAVERVRVLAARTFSELKGLSDATRQQLGRELTDGLIRGASPREMFRGMSRRLDISQKRALMIARTETVRAHAEGQLDALQRMGVEEVGVMVEWDTAGDDLVCPLCDAMSGEVIPIDKARLIIPRHPNCRCAWIPFIPDGRSTKKSARARVEASSKKAVDESIRREIPKRTRRSLKQQKELTAWPGADVKFKGPITPQAPAIGQPPKIDTSVVARDRNTLRRGSRSNFKSEHDIAVRDARIRNLTGSETLWQRSGLNDVEYAALQSYSGVDYLGINATLRGRAKTVAIRKSTKVAKAFERQLNSALDKLPAVPGKSFRGFRNVGTESLRAVKPGDVIADKGFASSSAKRSITDTFGPHKLIIESRSGRNITKMVGGVEEEILFKSNTRFRVISNEVTAEGHHLITIREI